MTQWGSPHSEAKAAAFGRYCFGPTFRGKSKTRRHLTEFWMVEPEMAFAELNDVMELAEDFLEYVIQRVLKNKAEEIKVLERDTSKLENVKKPFPRISYDEAVEILKKKGSEIEWGSDLGGTDETLVSEDEARRVVERGRWYSIRAGLPEVAGGQGGDGSLKAAYTSNDQVLDLHHATSRTRRGFALWPRMRRSTRRAISARASPPRARIIS